MPRPRVIRRYRKDGTPTYHLRGHKFLGVGRNRIAFRRGDVVVKVPSNSAGHMDNYLEAARWRPWSAMGEAQYARCRLLRNGWLVMVYAEPMQIADMPDWADFVDCRQVGRTRQGKVVAYDFGE